MGFFNPWGLLGALLAGPLIWVYFWREKRHVIFVSSIIPWRKLLLDQSRDTQSFRIDWQLILQILAVIFAALALARFYNLHKISTDYRVIVIDTSASMAAKGPRGTRLDEAKEKAIEIIDKAGMNTQISIIEMAGNSACLNNFTDRKSELKSIVETLKQKEESTDHLAAINLAHSVLADMRGKIHWISDSDEFVLQGKDKNEDLEIVKIGQYADNVAITGLDSYQGLFAADEQSIYLRVNNSSQSEKISDLNIYLNNKLLYQQKINMAPKSQQNFPIELQKAAGELKVELAADDGLSLDNRAYLLLEKRETTPVLLVTPSDTMEAEFSRLAKASGRITYKRARPQEYNSDMLKNFRAAIFHQAAPKELPSIDSIIIAPPQGHDLWEEEFKEIAKPQIHDWDRQHPTLKYLDFLDKITIDSARDTTLPSWGNLLMGSSELPLAFWGEENGYKQLIFNFDIQPLLFPDSQDISGIILMLNCLDWLSSTDNSIKTGDPFMLKSSQTIEEVIATLPSGEKITLKPNKSFLPFYQTHEAGIYHISAKDSGGVLRNYTFAANLLNDDEADLSITQTEIPVSQKAAVSGAVKPDNKIPMEFWRYLLIACVFFLLGEWWLYFKESE